MTICIPYATRGWGGPITFVRTFQAWLEKNGHTVVSDPHKRHDLLFIVERCPLWMARRAQRMKIPIVLRLDGVYHPGVTGRNGYLYPLMNFLPKHLQRYADYVVYQSEFSRISCERFLGKRPGAWSLIYNGVAVPDSFPEHAQRQTDQPLQLVTAASFRRSDQLIPIFESCRQLDVPYQLHVIGPITDPLSARVAPYLKDSAVTYHGPLAHDALQTRLQTFDLFLFSDLSACPHIVLEALAAGLPVVAFDRGSMRELVRHGVTGDVVPLPKHDQFRVKNPFTPEAYQKAAAAVERVADALEKYQHAAWQDARDRFAFDTMAEQYVALFEHLV